jgi:predicted lipoprotein with Yx(FWY)xxD motif
MGYGETIRIQVGSTAATCAPKPGDDAAPWNWGDPSAAIPGENLALGQDTDARLGAYLIGYNGMTLYTYAKDAIGTSTCSGHCAQAWPPYIVTSASLVAESPLDSGKIGTITRADGTKQLTWKGWPLYFYNADMAAGDVDGAQVANWSLAKP